jgi:diadenosine tetraphosphatase ApaH/serine/threonine PP2A family protein phosphatase
VTLALLSDVHANLPALQACLAHARAEGASAYAFLGDLVGYGAHPAEVLDTVMSLAAAGAVVLRGNHDEAALAPAAPHGQEAVQEVAARWTRGVLEERHLSFLAGLPLTARWEGALLVHASAEAPNDWVYVDHPMLAARSLAAAGAAGVRQVFCGHVHHQRLFYQGRGRGLLAFEPTPGVAIPLAAHRAWLATVGSVGQPRDGDPRAMYALFDATQHRLAFHRVAYDHAAAAAAIRRAGLPAPFADRLEQGR